jgi:cold shock CspA family protein
MRSRVIAILAVAALTLSAGVAAVGTASAATVRHLEGRVVSVDRDALSFRLRDSKRGTFTVFVVSSTRFQRVSFSALRAGKRVETTVRRANGRWQAARIEAAGARQAEPGDDNGGHGNDDGAGHR